MPVMIDEREPMKADREIEALSEVTGLTYCDDDCPCGEADGLMYWPVAGEGPPAWLPGWANGVGPEEVLDWMREEAVTDPAVREALSKVTTLSTP